MVHRKPNHLPGSEPGRRTTAVVCADVSQGIGLRDVRPLATCRSNQREDSEAIEGLERAADWFHMVMLGAVNGLEDRQRPLQAHSGAHQVAAVLQDEAEVAERAGHFGVVHAIGRLEDPQRPFQAVTGSHHVAEVPQNKAKAFRCAGDLRVVAAVRGLLDPQRPLEALSCALAVAELAQDDAEVVERAGDLGVVGASGGLGYPQRAPR